MLSVVVFEEGAEMAVVDVDVEVDVVEGLVSMLLAGFAGLVDFGFGVDCDIGCDFGLGLSRSRAG